MIRNVVKDGEGSGNEAGVTSRHALKVSLVEAAAGDLDPGIVTARKQFRGFLRNDGDPDLNVDGSSTPQEFLITAEGGSIIWVTAVRVLLNSINLELDTLDFRRFGAATAVSTPLTNGLEFFVEQSGEQTDFFIDPVTTIGDFMNYTDDFTNFVNSVGVQTDFLSFDFVFDVPVVLPQGSTDAIVMRVRDDLTAIDLFKVIVRGYQEFI